MRNWRNTLLPLLACLAVVGLALLPLRLSALRDRTLTGTVHTEELGTDSNFPARPPALERRLWLLVQWEEFPEEVTVIGQELTEGSEELETLKTAIREELAEWDVLPGDPESFTNFSGSRFYLRDPQDLSSAGFFAASGYVPSWDGIFTLTLDGETGHMVRCQIYFSNVKKHLGTPETVGRAFLDRLGLSYEEVTGWDSASQFRILDSGVCCLVEVDRDRLELVFQRDWAMEASDGPAGNFFDSSAVLK